MIVANGSNARVNRSQILINTIFFFFFFLSLGWHKFSHERNVLYDYTHDGIGEISPNYRSINSKSGFAFISCFCVVAVSRVFNLYGSVSLYLKNNPHIELTDEGAAHPSSACGVNDLGNIDLFPESHPYQKGKQKKECAANSGFSLMHSLAILANNLAYLSGAPLSGMNACMVYRGVNYTLGVPNLNIWDQPSLGHYHV